MMSIKRIKSFPFYFILHKPGKSNSVNRYNIENLKVLNAFL